jgi:geranylgeranyl diphosphate synthase type I
MELFQTGFLIHDDIMDRDLFRRGRESLFYQYKSHGDREGFHDSYHYGESMGICAGDIAFFLSFELLSELDCTSYAKESIIKLFSYEFSSVGLAQMQDVSFGHLDESPGEEAILNLYRYKTGRYTFSLPLAIGAILAERDAQELPLLGELGENLGLIFQIKDDEIGLFGSVEKTGKPVGSDLKENKKNLYHYYLLRNTGPGEREKLLRIFGSGQISGDDINFIREQVTGKGIVKLINEKVLTLRDKAGDLIGRIKNADPSGIAVLRELLDYSVVRTS